MLEWNEEKLRYLHVFLLRQHVGVPAVDDKLVHFSSLLFLTVLYMLRGAK